MRSGVGASLFTFQKHGLWSGARRFLTLADVDVPAPLRDLFEEIPGFREDVSSTEIRAEEGRE